MPTIVDGETGSSVRAKLNRVVGLRTSILSGLSYIVAADDHEKLLAFSSSGVVVVTVPLGLPTDFVCNIASVGEGTVTVVEGGANIESFEGSLRLAGRYATATLFCIGVDQFVLSGDLG